MKRLGRFELISFTTGFALLTYELAAARILAPSIGSSIYVWTGVIGVIIAALSAGFLIGGRIADARSKPLDVVWLLLLAAAFSVITALSYGGILEWVVASIIDARLQAVVAAVVLFAPTSFFIGTTSPYLAKLKVTSLASTGQAVASLDTFNAVGGIMGTFTTGFILFGYIGSREAIGLVAILLLAVSWLLEPRKRTAPRLMVSGILLCILLIPSSTSQGKVDIETASAHYTVINGYYNLRPATGLITGPGGTQSAVYTDGSNDLVFWYTQQMAELTIQQQPATVLVLGGGAYTMPQYLSKQLPNARIDVVEIDPQLRDISKQYFNYKSPANVIEHFADARTYVNTANKQYDVVLVDVYGDATIPFSLMTKEYGRAVGKLVAPNGILVANIIGGTRGGPCQAVVGALDAAYRVSLPYAYYTTESGRDERRANYIVVYSREATPSNSSFSKLPRYTQNVYTDEYAPAERLFFACQHAT